MILLRIIVGISTFPVIPFAVNNFAEKVKLLCDHKGDNNFYRIEKEMLDSWYYRYLNFLFNFEEIK